MEGYIAGGGEDAWTGYLSTARQVHKFCKHKLVFRVYFLRLSSFCQCYDGMTSMHDLGILDASTLPVCGGTRHGLINTATESYDPIVVACS